MLPDLGDGGTNPNGGTTGSSTSAIAAPRVEADRAARLAALDNKLNEFEARAKKSEFSSEFNSLLAQLRHKWMNDNSDLDALEAMMLELQERAKLEAKPEEPPPPALLPTERIKPPEPPEPEHLLTTLSFTKGSARMCCLNEAKLDEVGLRLKQEPAMLARITGGAVAGEARSLTSLARRRAEAARSYLVTRHGIHPGRIQIAVDLKLAGSDNGQPRVLVDLFEGAEAVK